MDANKWSTTGQGGEAAMDAGNWRAQLQSDSRQEIVNKIMETLKTHFQFSGQEGLLELQKIAVLFEENIYSTSTSQADYLRNISLKMLPLAQNTMSDSLPPNPFGNKNRTLNAEAQGEKPLMNVGDWRAQLPPDSRQRIVNKIMETIKKRLPFSGQEGLEELKKIAVRFEEKIYTAATSSSDYLRKMSLKMLTMESKSPNYMPNSLPSNLYVNSNKPPDAKARSPMKSFSVTSSSASNDVTRVPSLITNDIIDQDHQSFGIYGCGGGQVESDTTCENSWDDADLDSQSSRSQSDEFDETEGKKWQGSGEPAGSTTKKESGIPWSTSPFLFS